MPEVTISIHDLWHGPVGLSVGTVAVVDLGDEQRLGTATGLVATVAVGVAAVASGVPGTTDGRVSAVAVWWTAYSIYAVAFVLDAGYLTSRLRWVAERPLLAVQLVAGAVAWLAAPGLEWTAALLVVTAASAAFTLGARGTAAVVMAQSAVVALGSLLDEWSIGDVLVVTAVYGSFQGFAALVVRSERREAAARVELTAAHADLRAASIALAATARTAERLRISRDLHDLVGHQLTALVLELEVAHHQPGGGSVDHITRARTIAKDLLRNVRRAVGELRREGEELEPALRSLVADLPGLTVDLRVAERTPVDEASALMVVRCVQEIVTNTLRHADADSLTVDVVSDESGLRLDARDNGRGTDRIVTGYGLTGLRERVEQFGGELALRSAAGHGFAVRVQVPAP